MYTKCVCLCHNYTITFIFSAPPTAALGCAPAADCRTDRLESAGRGGGAVPVRTEQFSVSLRDNPYDSDGSRGAWWASLLGLDGPNSAYEQLILAGGEPSASSYFLRIHPLHVTAKLWRCSHLPPVPPSLDPSLSLQPPASSDGSLCVTLHAQKHAGMLVGFSHDVVLKAQRRKLWNF